MEEILRPRLLEPAAIGPATEGNANDDAIRQIGSLLEVARSAIASKLSTDSRRYVRSAAQHGGQ
jgi:hypothetical protein